jgi:ubiquinol-cytochrome c reductase iron-sulfur subunit
MKEEVDTERRKFLLTATKVAGGVGCAFAATPFVSSWLPSAKAMAAGAPVEVDLSKMEPGQQVTVEWRGKPVWIIKRTQAMLDTLNKTRERLRDPDSQAEQQPNYAKNEHRSRTKEFLILVGVCTHLGCSPKYKPDLGEMGPNWPGGFYCPCHGSTFDLAGRVFQGVPAPLNLEVPPHYFPKENYVVVGEDSV